MFTKHWDLPHQKLQPRNHCKGFGLCFVTRIYKICTFQIKSSASRWQQSSQTPPPLKDLASQALWLEQQSLLLHAPVGRRLPSEIQNLEDAWVGEKWRNGTICVLGIRAGGRDDSEMDLPRQERKTAPQRPLLVEQESPEKHTPPSPHRGNRPRERRESRERAWMRTSPASATAAAPLRSRRGQGDAGALRWLPGMATGGDRRCVGGSLEGRPWGSRHY